MRFPVTVKPFTGQWDVAAWTGTLMLVLLFILLLPLVPTPGVRLELPAAADLPGLDEPVLPVAVDRESRFYFRNQVVDESALLHQLQTEARQYTRPPALLIHADRRTPYETLVRLALLARQAGLSRALLATQPADSKTPEPFTSTVSPRS
jgi:biopolymer transport protein ExbD